ncbi:MAG: TIGR03862 family flavoprotein [Betaproteobacteria bacterium]|nr:TIGR03862 family flavoprotein [Betaproteobacteria bacterium]
MSRVLVVGGGPAGLMAAEAALARGARVALCDAKPSVGRKFLIAGRGGLNLTHSEPFDRFIARYPNVPEVLRDAIAAFTAPEIVRWARSLGIETFVGTSGRVFPSDFKAAPLLRAWVHRLRAAGLALHVRHRWTGFADDGSPRFDTPDGVRAVPADATVLALGGASWPHLGSDAAWVPVLSGAGVRVVPLRPANCGFDVRWSAHFSSRHAGAPLKSVIASTCDRDGHVHGRRGELVVTGTGVEGGVVYALSGWLRDAIADTGAATLELDLAPDRTEERLAADLGRPRGRRSLARHWQAVAGLEGVRAGLLRECLPADALNDVSRVARTIKALPLRLVASRPIAEAISTAGGVAFDELDGHLMLRKRPGVFVAGEMLDWEAPTGGYLLTGCLATGRLAGEAAAGWASGAGSGDAPGPTG